MEENSIPMKLYYYAPPWVKNVFSSLYGAHLNSWRYDKKLESLVEEIRGREGWSASQWKDWKTEKLTRLLHRAATHVPYYRAYWTKQRRLGNRSSNEILENWPVLEKEELRKNPKSFLADDCNSTKMLVSHTSGSSGTPLTLWWSRKTSKLWYAFFEARWRRWHGVSIHDRWAILGQKHVISIKQQKPPFWVWNAPMNQLYLSPIHLAKDFIPYYLEAMRKYKVKYLYAFPSTAYAVASWILKLKLNKPKLKFLMTNAEPITSHQRKILESAFECDVRESYGMREIAAAAGECFNGQLHLWPDVGHLELMKHGKFTNEKSGEIITTGLINEDMPLIRYRIRDIITLAGDSKGCTCGRTLPVAERIEGRMDDIIYGSSGQWIGRLDAVFKGGISVKDAKIIQENLRTIRVLITPDKGFQDSSIMDLQTRLKERLGDVNVTVEKVDMIPREPNGKIKYVVCKLTEEEKKSININ